jgi:hypothetical protein
MVYNFLRYGVFGLYPFYKYEYIAWLFSFSKAFIPVFTKIGHSVMGDRRTDLYYTYGLRII